MNSNYTMNSAATRTLRALWATLCLLAMLWVVPTQAQISYVEGFAGCDAATCNNWTIAGGYAPSLSPNDPFGEGYTPCVAANPAAKTNLYSAALTTTLTSNASVGTSNGQLATLGFSYKVIDYLTSATTPAGEAEVSAWYSETSNTGPWTQIGSAFTNAATGTCIASPSFTFTPSNGSPVFIQIRGTNLLPDFDGFWLVIDDISVAQGAGSNCNATPAPGNTISSVPNVCSGTNFTLSLQNATSGDGVTYQWQRDTGMGFQNFGTSSPTQVVSQAQATTYRCIVTCAFSSPTDGTSTPVSVGMTSYLTCYCNSVTFTSNVETISLVQFSNINNSSACGVGLPPANPFIEDFTSITGNVFKGIPYTMTVSGETDGNFTTFFTAFFDFDQDGIFEANFPIGSITNTSCVTTVSNSVLIPVGAATGVSRMRIIKVFAASPTNPCGTYGFGQAEDYLVNVQPPPACTEPAAPGATLSTAASVCDGESFTLSMSTPPLGGYTYDWQSADDAGFTVNVQTGLGTGLTYVASQSTAKYYRCVVTCVTAVPSTPLQVTMNTAFLPVDFTPVTFPPNCWTLSAPPADLLSRQAPSAFGVGTGSARFNFFGVTSGTQSMISPVLGATPANYQVRFDIAGTTFTGGEVDTVYAEASIDGGTSWTIHGTMLNNVGGLANTIGATSGLNFVPTAGQWNTLTFPVPTGANRLRFRGGSNFGNQVYLDNIVLEAIPTCIAPTLAGLTAATTSSTSFQINWVVQPTAVSYDVEVRTDALAPESPGAFLTDNTAATTYNVTAGLVVGQTYSVYVRSQCGVNGTSAWTGPRAYVHDYCVAGAGALGDPTQVIANFTFAGINQNNASNAGYLNFTSPQLAIVAPGVPTPFTRTYNTTYSNDSLHIWIDLDGDRVRRAR
ncbi:MAG: hypothetical protein IPJ85_03495 [Flavobacteriales bacterium]|nr:hypothetical protein [Flavobacteriales bacterium]